MPHYLGFTTDREVSMFEGMSEEHKALCIADAINVLKLIQVRQGAPIHISEMPVSFASGMWLNKQHLFTTLTVQPYWFRCFLTSDGVEFIRTYGRNPDEEPITLRMLPPDVAGQIQLDRVFVQTKTGRIFESWDLENLPTFVKDTVKMGMLAVHNGLLYGLSEEHLRDN